MRTLTTLILFLAAGALLTNEQKPEPFSLKGKVVSADGKPVAGAIVEIRSNAVGMEKPGDYLTDRDDLLAKTTSDDKGVFAFKDVTLPRIAARAALAREYLWYAIARAGEHGLTWRRLNLQAPSEEITLTLHAAATIRGRITDAAGKPLAGAQVRVTGISLLQQSTPPVPSLNLYRSQMGLSAVSGADGRVSIAGLPREARIDVQVSQERHVLEGVMVATTDRSQPAIVHRFADRSGQVRTRQMPVHLGEFTLALRPGHRLKGQVVHEDTGKPVAGAGVMLRAEEGAYFRAKADAEGRFTCDQLPPGKFWINAVATEKNNDYLAAHADVTIPENQTEVTFHLKLPRGITATGKVVDEETGQGIAGVTIWYYNATRQNGMTPISTVSEKDGSFRLAVPPGPGRLKIAGQVSGYVLPLQPAFYQRLTDEPDSPFSKGIVAKPNEQLASITFKLGKGLAVSGRIVDADGKPVAGARLFRLETYSVNWNAPAATTQGDGSFSIRGLDPYTKHLFIAQHEQRRLAATHTLKASKDQKRIDGVEIKLAPLATLTGRVVDEDKKPIAGVAISPYIQVQIEQDGNTYSASFSLYFHRPVKTGKDGRFTADFLVPGFKYQAYAQADGYAQAYSGQFEPGGGQKHEVGDIMLVKADQTVSGRVVTPAGRPLAGVQVYAYSRRRGNFVSSSEAVFTDKEGRFTIGKLPRGPVEINAISERDEQGIGMSNRVTAQSGASDVRIVMFLRRKAAAVEALAGKPAPEFPVAAWLNGKPRAESAKGFARAAFQGKVVLLAFVDEAKPSQRILPRLQTIAEKYRDRGLFVLRVHEFGAAEDLVKLSPLPAALVSSGLVPVGFSDAYEKYGVRATPTLFLIDKQGVLRHVDVKPEDAEALVKKLLEG
jgi:protocatechuate 3,4-dioxygenase beta subunit